MEIETKLEVKRLLREDSRESALEYLLGWLIGLNANGALMTKEDVAFVFDILGDNVPESEDKYAQ